MPDVPETFPPARIADMRRALEKVRVGTPLSQREIRWSLELLQALAEIERLQAACGDLARRLEQAERHCRLLAGDLRGQVGQ